MPGEKLFVLSALFGQVCLPVTFKNDSSVRSSPHSVAIFDPDPEVIAAGRIRLEYIFFAYLFSFAQEALSGYPRGFGVFFIAASWNEE